MCTMAIRAVSMADYEESDGDKDRVLDKSVIIGHVELDTTSDLRHVRPKITKLGTTKAKYMSVSFGAFDKISSH